tara:strand:- start:2585 stop:3778 length:1194 start_codon:yes stop_codon:yes gene_type:complete
MIVVNKLFTSESIKKASYKSPLVETLPSTCFVKRKDYIQQDLIVKRNNVEIGNVFHRAGPTEKIAFDTSRTNVAIVNAGGLCPGINNVLYDLVYTLEKLYNINTIYGIQNGFTGLGKYNMLELSVEDIEGIQHDSGSLLGTSRGVLDVEKFSLLMNDNRINQLYVIGGNGTHKGAFELSKHTDVSIVCIPKTIDNDFPIIDKSFGYETAVEQARQCIMSAYYEAKDTENGLGIVKLMGRHCGWIALNACLSSYNVDICLIPEYPYQTEKLIEYVKYVMQNKGFCLIVVAEGVQSKGEQNDIGLHLRELFHNTYCVKYIDPTYIIRSIPANTSDCLYCKLLAQSAVHAGMSGYTGCTVGYVNNKLCIIPLDEITSKTNYVSEMMWNRLLQSNLQPNLN